VLYAGFPLLAAWRGRVRLASGLSLRRAAWLAFPAAVLVALSLWPLEAQFSLWLRSLRTMPLRSEVLAGLRDLRAMNPALVLAALSVVPALVEELFFRGYLFNALRTVARPLATVVGSAVLFGLFHLIVVDSLMWERLPITMLLGLLLGWMRWRTGSLLPGMLLHAAHNGVLMAALLWPRSFGPLGMTVRTSTEIPLEWLLAGGAGVILGVALLWWATRKRVDGEAATASLALPVDGGEETPAIKVSDVR
jgi:sodium transport system permease protein